MASVQKSVLVPYSAAQMFELVERVEEYPQFLPWSAGTRVVETAAGPLVSIDLDYHGVANRFIDAFVHHAKSVCGPMA